MCVEVVKRERAELWIYYLRFIFFFFFSQLDKIFIFIVNSFYTIYRKRRTEYCVCLLKFDSKSGLLSKERSSRKIQKERTSLIHLTLKCTSVGSNVYCAISKWSDRIEFFRNLVQKLFEIFSSVCSLKK